MIFSVGLLESLWYIAVPSGLFLAAIAIILIVSSQLLSSSYGRINISIDKRRLRNAMIFVAVTLMITMAVIIVLIRVDPDFEDHLHNALSLL